MSRSRPNRSPQPLSAPQIPKAERSDVWPLPVLNPTRGQWIAGAIILGAFGLGTYAVIESRKHGARLPPMMPPEGTAAPGGPCDLGPSYPGFIFDGVECQPSDETPPGIYLVDNCNDFIFVKGDDGPQPDYLEAMITIAVTNTLQGVHGTGTGPSLDPIQIVNGYLKKFWPECDWPPSPDAPERIVQLYMVLCVLVGRTIVLHGGRVLGHYDFDGADEAIGESLKSLGFAYFRPDVVSEIELPKPPAGPFPGEPKPQQGTFGEPTGPGHPGTGIQQGTNQLPPPQIPPPPQPVPITCHNAPYHHDHHETLPRIGWAARKTVTIDLFDISGSWSQCDGYEIWVGVCLRDFTADLYGSFTDILDKWSAAAIAGAIPDVTQHNLQQLPIMTPQGEMPPTPASQWAVPPTWKTGFHFKVTRHAGLWGFSGDIAVDKSVDTCPQHPQHWPSPKGPNGFYNVWSQSQTWLPWNPIPEAQIVLDGHKVQLKISYSGFPKIKQYGSENRATYFGTRPTLYTGVHAAALGPPQKG